MTALVAAVVALVVVTGPFRAEVATPIATPDASPVASPAASPTANGCEALAAYFQQLATLTRANAGYVTVRTDPGGVFAMPANEAEAIATSLETLIAELAAIEPPAAAVAYHQAFTDLVVWYRDLALAEDFNTFQRIVNRDKQLIPAISQASFAGQATCGTEAWTTAWNDAFGTED
jgi:hypothetical protein